MESQRKIDVLEGVVSKRTPEYISLGNPIFDRKLLSAHYVLAKLYFETGDIEQAKSHIGKAETELHNIARVGSKKPEYITSEFDFEAYRKQEAEDRKRFERQRTLLFDLARRIGYDVSGLLFSDMTDEEKEVGIIGDPWKL